MKETTLSWLTNVQIVAQARESSAQSSSAAAAEKLAAAEAAVQSAQSAAAAAQERATSAEARAAAAEELLRQHRRSNGGAQGHENGSHSSAPEGSRTAFAHGTDADAGAVVINIGAAAVRPLKCRVCTAGFIPFSVSQVPGQGVSS